MNYNYVNDDRWTQPNYGGLLLVDWQDEFSAWHLYKIISYPSPVEEITPNTAYLWDT